MRSAPCILATSLSVTLAVSAPTPSRITPAADCSLASCAASAFGRPSSPGARHSSHATAPPPSFHPCHLLLPNLFLPRSPTPHPASITPQDPHPSLSSLFALLSPLPSDFLLPPLSLSTFPPLPPLARSL